MAADHLTNALLLEEVAARHTIADALFASVVGGAPLLRALVDAGAATPELVRRHVSQTSAPTVRHVAPLQDLVVRLPPGLCARLLAVPVRRDPLTGTVDVVVADPSDPHPGREIAFHLGVDVRLVRAPIEAIEEALRAPEPYARSGGVTAPPALRSHAPRSPFGVTVPSARPAAARMRTPPWGTPIHSVQRPPTEPPASGRYGSEIPIPLTRRTYGPGAIVAAVSGHAPSEESPVSSDGYPVDVRDLHEVVEIGRTGDGVGVPSYLPPLGSFIPGPPPLPRALVEHAAPAPSPRSLVEHAAPAPSPRSVVEPAGPSPSPPDSVAALRTAGARDEVLDLVLSGARAVAPKVALFVVKRGGYLGWLGTPEFAERAALQSVLIPLDADSVFDRAVHEDLYLGPIRYDEVHAPLLRVMRNPSRDVAVVPVRVSGKTAVIIVADALGDTMTGTRRLEELARAAGEAFARIVRARR